MPSSEPQTRVDTALLRHRLAWPLALALALVQLGLLASTAWDKSDTADEPYYLFHSLWLAKKLDFAVGCEVPPLPRWGFAAALRLADPEIFGGGSGYLPNPLWDRSYDQMRLNLMAARMTTGLLTVLGGLLLWWTARNLFGPAAAALTHALWCFSPSVLAHGALATLDPWATALTVGVAWCTLRFVRAPTPGRAAAIGVALGLAGTAKITAVGLAPVVALVGGWAVVRGRPAGCARRLAASVAACSAAALFTIWAVYGFSVGWVPAAHGCTPAESAEQALFGPAPFPMYIQSGLNQWRHGQAGHYNYLFGETGADGWWWFYLAALALKTTLGTQLLAALRLLASLRTLRRGDWLVDLALLGYPALLFTVMSLGSTQNGIKYLLPAFPLAMLWLGRAAPLAEAAFGAWGARAVAGALVLGVAGSLAVHPHHLMYFNAWAGGPDGGPRYLIHGDDWGQDQRRLAEWQKQNRLRQRRHFFYTYYNGNPDAWGLLWRRPRCEPTPGTHALHAVEVHRPKRTAAGCLDWLTVEPPDLKLGWSIYVYRVDEERLGRLAEKRNTETPFWRSGPPP
jgi:hypothetical protein